LSRVKSREIESEKANSTKQNDLLSRFDPLIYIPISNSMEMQVP